MTRTRPLHRFLPFALAAVVAGVWFAHAGDLDPPAGPITPTMKTLDEVEPRIAINSENTPGDADSLFKITQPGSYYLTDNITGVVGKHGIEIAASGVTLDLNGFELLGVAGSLDGVSVTVTNQQNIAVVNGSVRDWRADGVDLGTTGSGSNNCRVEGVLATFNVGNGIINVGAGCTVTNCSAYLNSAKGISTGNACTIANCAAYQNTGGGISTGAGCTITNCSAFQNSSNGISTNAGCTVTHCSASFNGANGISMDIGSSIIDCSARSNSLDGILCTAQCILRGNTCSSNGNGGDGAGIHTTGSDNRIEGNNCTIADRGIDVDAAGNFITRNVASGNGINWDVAASNIILVVNATAAGAVNGNSGGTAPGSTDPNANFTY